MSSLSFEQAPPVSVPTRFFLTAPFFGVLAGVILMALGGQALTVRWEFSTLALTHLFTVGFMLQTMCGALMQFVPVAAGGNIWRPRLIASVVHPCITLAAVLFAAAFLSGHLHLLDVAAGLFACVLLIFAIAVGVAVFRKVGKGDTIRALRFAVIGLIITATTGVVLVQVLFTRMNLPFIVSVNVHALWGLVGWAGVLLAGVGYFVIPMFQMTAPFPQWVQRALAPLIFLALLVWSVQAFSSIPALNAVSLLVILAGCTLFAITTLILQTKRKRKVSDSTLVFFRVAMICILLIVVTAVLAHTVGVISDSNYAPLVIGILALHGVFGSVICGMLYKILPFILWLNLQKLEPSLATKVSTRKLLGETPMKRHLYLHCACIVLLLLAIFVPMVTRPAGLVLVISYGWLEFNLIQAWKTYGRNRPAPKSPVATTGAAVP